MGFSIIRPRVFARGVQDDVSHLCADVQVGSPLSEYGVPRSIPDSQWANSARRCCWSVGFLGGLPFPLPFHSGAAPYSPRFTLIGSQDLDVKSRPYTLTHSLSYKTRIQEDMCSIPGPVILISFTQGFLKWLQANAGIVHYCRPWPVPERLAQSLMTT
ncbi:hypothetical protein PR048_005811 [Dryococelus australis]|uniref:Uncharacterized protein n=1 Tax=Dryococelus australis TaxID=614101 RepID=A0ABQ9I986_9NEOP|nr:hypothetical protein PR048_005811 [Dryococelus australis]